MIVRILICCLFMPLFLTGQEALVKEYRIIRDAFHIVPLAPSSKGNSIGVGYARPIAPKWMIHGTVSYLYSSTLEDSPARASGIVFTPALIYLPGTVDNYKGFTFGVELPVLAYTIKRNQWNTVTVINETGSLSFQKFQLIRARAFQGGVAGRVGFRTHKLNHTFFWQPNFCLGILFQHIKDYDKPTTNGSNFIGNPFTNQTEKAAPYVRLEIAFGLYRYKKQTLQTIQF
ncbi:MAG: hypothetical protein J5I59_00105 [Saprospiraceae bacterium]|nr:hypothetical protein [Saprospiraceae bacterium]